MSNPQALSRTNYFHCDKEALEQSLSQFPVRLEQKGDTYCLISDDPDTGLWPQYYYGDDDEEIYLDFKTLVMPFVNYNEVVILMEAGYEKERYNFGWAEAWVRKENGDIQSCAVGLNDIYHMASVRFGISNINAAEY